MRCCSEAYPRWCGEHVGEVAAAALFEGLPPLVRGARCGDRHPDRACGPTPAGAGSTMGVPAIVAATRAYPRWCGEHRLENAVPGVLVGLPPLVRGAQNRPRVAVTVPGPTPAGAGSTGCTTTALACPAAYPRWCGEHVLFGGQAAWSVGLPPLVRGAPDGEPFDGVGGGPTPAGAGSTTAAGSIGGRVAAYPRWCGEHALFALVAGLGEGLPPLVRGAHQLRARARQHPRPTPAGAGSTLRDLLV